jgi:hypothetical protein
MKGSLKRGDRVKHRSTGEEGFVEKMRTNRGNALVRFGDRIVEVQSADLERLREAYEGIGDKDYRIVIRFETVLRLVPSEIEAKRVAKEIAGRIGRLEIGEATVLSVDPEDKEES